MSSFLNSYGRLGPGAFAARIILVIAVWAGLVFVMLHYVGKVWPHDYQVREAEEAEADDNARKAAEKPAALTPATGNTTAAATTTTGNVTAAAATPAAGSPGTPAVASTTAAPAASTTAPATSTATATAPTAAPAPAAMAASATGATPAVATSTPATASAAPTTTTAPAATGAASGKPEVKEPPRDPRLDGYNRHAFFNVAIFYSIVISVLASGTALTQIIKRLRDLGWNGMLSVLFLVPGVNVLFVLALMFTPGKPAPQAAH